MKAARRNHITEKELPLDVKAILKQRSERFRLYDSIFEDDTDGYQGSTGGTSEEKEKDVKEVHVGKHIDFKRKGMDILNDLNAGQLFDEELLYSKLMQTKSPKLKNHPIYNITRTDLYNVLMKGFLKMHKQTVASQISEYLFFLMSGHSSERLVEACFDTLKYHLQITSGEASSNFQLWRPTLENIISVFVNYGVSRDVLESENIPVSNNDAPVCKCPLQSFPKRNFFWVLKFITSLLFFCKNAYTIDELDQLLMIILTVSLDKHFINMEIHENLEISKCIKRILKSYPSSGSSEKEVNKVSRLSEMIYCKFQNVSINDMYFIVSYYLDSPGLGHKLDQSLTFKIIKHEIWPNEKVSSIDEINEIKKLGKFFRKETLIHLDYYTQYYILLHLERFITKMIFGSNNLEHLKLIRTWLLNLRMRPPSIEEVIDYHLVKELITRTATMWKLCLTEVK